MITNNAHDPLECRAGPRQSDHYPQKVRQIARQRPCVRSASRRAFSIDSNVGRTVTVPGTLRERREARMGILHFPTTVHGSSSVSLPTADHTPNESRRSHSEALLSMAAPPHPPHFLRMDCTRICRKRKWRGSLQTGWSVRRPLSGTVIRMISGWPMICLPIHHGRQFNPTNHGSIRRSRSPATHRIVAARLPDPDGVRH